MIDRKTILLAADGKFKNHKYLDETLELLDRCVAIMNENHPDGSSFDQFEGLEGSDRVTSSLMRINLKKFLRDRLDLSNKDTAYFVASFVWKNHVEKVLRWFISMT